MGRIRHKRNHHARRDISRAARTRARTLDPDQVQANLQDDKLHDKLLHPDHLDIEKPGLGLFYCVPCDRHFPSDRDREVHQLSKLHRRIAKRMREEKAYTVEESMWAAGIGVDNRQRKASSSSSSSKQPQSSQFDGVTTRAAAAAGAYSSPTTAPSAIEQNSSSTQANQADTA